MNVKIRRTLPLLALFALATLTSACESGGWENVLEVDAGDAHSQTAQTAKRK